MSLHYLLALQSGNPLGSLGLALPFVLMFGVLYLVVIMPQQRKQKKWQTMLNSLKNGDKVITSGGLRGTILAIKDDYLHLRVPPDNLRLEVSRGSIVSVTTAEETTTSK